jgi:hypothetical protein
MHVNSGLHACTALCHIGYWSYHFAQEVDRELHELYSRTDLGVLARQVCSCLGNLVLSALPEPLKACIFLTLLLLSSLLQIAQLLHDSRKVKFL